MLLQDQQLDVLCLTETWLTPDVMLEFLTFPGCSVLRRDRALEPFMERVTRTGYGAEWTTGGYGYFSVTGLGAGRITDLRYQDGAKPQK